MIMIIQIGLFAMILGGVAIIIFSKNIVHAAYALALVLMGLAGIYVLLNAELLAIVQILLYAVGVVILLVFGVMITNRLKGGKLLSESRNTIIAFLLSTSIFTGLVYLLSQISIERDSGIKGENQIQAIGMAFLTNHIVAFELIAFVLLVVLVGASYLAKMSSDD